MVSTHRILNRKEAVLGEDFSLETAFNSYSLFHILCINYVCH